MSVDVSADGSRQPNVNGSAEGVWCLTQSTSPAVLVPRSHKKSHQGDGDQSEHDPTEEGFDH